jgi:hypothetical protein
MSRGTRVAFFALIILLCIVGVFVYLTPPLLHSLGSGSIILAWIIGITASCFFVILGVFGLILSIVILADRIHRYAVIREERERKRIMRRGQLNIRRNRLGGKYSYRSRQPVIRQQQSEHKADNGC